jgi:HK97 family phage prohead protease
MTVKEGKLRYKSFISKVKEVGENGIVIFYAAVFGNTDRYNEICDKGCFKKTIKENFAEIMHYKNHWSENMPGVIQELKEDDYGLLVTSKLILDTVCGEETYAQYKAMAEAGKSMPHSIGYIPVKIDQEDPSNPTSPIHLKEIFLGEVSTLTRRAANPLATTVDIKSLEEMDMEELLKEQKFYDLLLNCKFTDIKLEQLEKLKSYIQSLIIQRSRETTSGKGEPTDLSKVAKAIQSFTIN